MIKINPSRLEFTSNSNSTLWKEFLLKIKTKEQNKKSFSILQKHLSQNTELISIQAHNPRPFWKPWEIHGLSFLPTLLHSPAIVNLFLRRNTNPGNNLAGSKEEGMLAESWCFLADDVSGVKLYRWRQGVPTAAQAKNCSFSCTSLGLTTRKQQGRVCLGRTDGH